jgi:hypothetical protein
VQNRSGRYSTALPRADCKETKRWQAAPQCPLSGVKRTSLFAAQMSAYDPKRTCTRFVTAIATASAKCAKINHTRSNFRRRCCLSPHRSSIFIIYFHRLIIAFQETRERDFARAETIDETVCHLCSVCSLDWLLPLAAARGGANVHLTGLLHQNCSHHTD